MPPSDPEYGAASRYNPPGYKPGPLHIALVLTDLVGHAHPLVLTPAWMALAAIACWPWGTLRVPVAVLSLAFTIADGTGLALLPRMGRSFGPVTPPLLALALIHTALALTAGHLWATLPGLLLTSAVNLAISGAFLYATWIEPFYIGVTQVELRSPKLNGHTPLRLLHISDVHVERTTAREERLLRLVEELDPDVIVITGDYLNLTYVYDTKAQADAHDLLARLCDIARGPIYAITGSPPVDRTDVVPLIFKDLPITWLLDEIREVEVNGHALQIAGLRCTRERRADVPRLRRLLGNRPEHKFTLLLYHSPDLMPEAAELDVDLYLCGHTHGGQVRLPCFGALITSSDFRKRYEMGRYKEGGTTLYVSRGLGMEGLGAPRARFLAPPEIVLWTLSSQAPHPTFRRHEATPMRTSAPSRPSA
jgi:predicted MPP superfamily phosphohydrolase